MKRVTKTQARKSHDRLINGYERLLAEKNHEVVAVKAALIQMQSEKDAESERRLVTVEDKLDDVRAKVTAPPRNFGLLENIDGSALWLAFFWLVTTTYTTEIKAGLPWIYVCFHLGLFFVLIRYGVQMCLTARMYITFPLQADLLKTGLKESVRLLQRYQLLAGIYFLADVWVDTRFNYPISLPFAVFLGVSGAYSLYCGVINPIKVIQERLVLVQKKLQRLLDPNTLLGTAVWPIPNADSPAYGKPEVALPLIEKVEKDVMGDCPAKDRFLYAFEFWKVKRNLKKMIKEEKRIKATTEVGDNPRDVLARNRFLRTVVFGRNLISRANLDTYKSRTGPEGEKPKGRTSESVKIESLPTERLGLEE